MKIHRRDHLTLFEDSPGVSETVREILNRMNLAPSDAISLLDLSEEVGEAVGLNRDKVAIEVRQAIERLTDYRLFTVKTHDGRRSFIGRVSESHDA